MATVAKAAATLFSDSYLDCVIDCRTLSEADWSCIARQVTKRHVPFGRVVSASEGGENLVQALEPHQDPTSGYVLVVDDVLTTGSSMEEARRKLVAGGTHINDVLGFVFCARASCPSWVTPWLMLNRRFWD